MLVPIALAVEEDGRGNNIPALGDQDRQHIQAVALVHAELDPVEKPQILDPVLDELQVVRAQNRGKAEGDFPQNDILGGDPVSRRYDLIDPDGRGDRKTKIAATVDAPAAGEPFFSTIMTSPGIQRKRRSQLSSEAYPRLHIRLTLYKN